LSRSAFTHILPTAMFSLSPRPTLLLLLALAGIILAGGLRLARQEQDVRIDRDREVLQRFSGEVQRELRRLEELYESHLSRLARTTAPEDAFEARRASERIIGIRQYSVLHRNPKPVADLHIQIIAKPNERTPVPMFEAPRTDGPGLPVLLDRKLLFNGDDLSSGWVDEPGKPLMFWQRISGNEVVVLIIELPAVEDAVTRWLQSWASERFEPIRAGGGPDQLRTRDGHTLFAEGESSSARPDLLLPLRSRLGAWELASWDRRETRIHYNDAVLTTTSVLAVVVALLAVLIFGQQRRAAALAAQRVSFVNRVSHELRSPLTNILLNIDLATEAVSEAPRESERRLALVQEETRRLGRLIDNVLTFSRHEQGKLRLDPRACVPASVIIAVVEQFAPSFARRSLEVRRSGDLTTPCLLDADAFAQVLANLLSNVEKYVPGGLVEIAGTIANGNLVLTVSDQGPGIPAEAAERIFHPFERLYNRVNEGVSGTGLGLAIARDLAATMGGTLRLLPGVRGATFELRIPAPSAPPLTAVSAA
jgi:signal transduction histidine kinase